MSLPCRYSGFIRESATPHHFDVKSYDVAHDGKVREWGFRAAFVGTAWDLLLNLADVKLRWRAKRQMVRWAGKLCTSANCFLTLFVGPCVYRHQVGAVRSLGGDDTSSWHTSTCPRPLMYTQNWQNILSHQTPYNVSEQTFPSAGRSLCDFCESAGRKWNWGQEFIQLLVSVDV